MTDKEFNRRINKIFADKRKELLEQLSRLDSRKEDGWRYRRVLRKAHSVKAYKVKAHYAMVPVKYR